MKFLSILLSLWFFFFVGIESKILGQYPDCKCDGIEYFIQQSLVITHPCGKWAVCAFDMKYYFQHMPKASNTGFPTISEYEKTYKDIITQYRYPIDASLKPMIAKCRTEHRKCEEEKIRLIKAECIRFKPEMKNKWVDFPEITGPITGHEIFTKDMPYHFSPRDEFGWNWWRMFFNGRDGSKTAAQPKYRANPLNKTFMWPTCPYWHEKPSFTMGVLLSQFGGVAYHPELAVHVLVSFLNPIVVRALHCDFFSERYDEMYLPYNGTEFCKSWHQSGVLVCVTLNKDPIDNEKRDIVKQCNGPPLPPGFEAVIDYNDRLMATGKIKDDNLWEDPVNLDYPEMKRLSSSLSFPWFPPYRTPPHEDPDE